MDFAVPTDHIVKLKESEKRDKYLDLAKGIEKTVEHESDNYTNCNWCTWYSHQRIDTRPARGLINNRTGGVHSNFFVIEIGQNTEKSPGDLKILAFTQTRAKDQ